MQASKQASPAGYRPGKAGPSRPQVNWWLRLTSPAAGRLLSVLQRMNDGQATISWLDPRQFSTQVPLVDEMARYLYFMLQGKTVPSAQTTRPYPFDRRP